MNTLAVTLCQKQASIEREETDMRRHTIDVLFSLSLFMVFVICSFFLLLFQINGYHKISEDENSVYQASSYIKNMVRDYDRYQEITIEEIDGHSCLRLHNDHEVVYLYVDNHMLKELYQIDQLSVNLSYGEDRFAMDSMIIQEKNNKLYITMEHDGVKNTLMIALRSGGVLS